MFYRVRSTIEGFKTEEVEASWDGILLDALNKGGCTGHVGFAMGVAEILVKPCLAYGSWLRVVPSLSVLRNRWIGPWILARFRCGLAKHHIPSLEGVV